MLVVGHTLFCSTEDTSLADGESADVIMSSKKKRVSWAASENLAQIHYFEMDDSERGTMLGLFIDFLFL